MRGTGYIHAKDSKAEAILGSAVNAQGEIIVA